jgi:lipopolysaccharide/colanic/teichoic acid biosynthesis glycosyltransferase
MNSRQMEVRSPEETAPHGVAVPGWKRVLDISLVILALPLLLPVMVCIALIIRIVSEGPILFRQERVGYLGRRFMCFKFRTMVAGIETASHQGHLTALMSSNKPMEKMDAKGDPRIIPCGVPLRSSGLDELPQIINVIRGDMSLVGPRPCVPYEYDKYLPWHKERLKTVPGLTGLWQVSGKNNTSFDEMIHLDIDYIKRRSPWLDILIIFKTVPALIVQMIETRSRRKSLSRAVRPAVSGPTVNQ